MPKPTIAALRRKPQAVVMLASPLADIDNVDHDYEWFETDEGRQMFFDDVKDFAQVDIDEQGDMVHVLVSLSSTEPLTVAEVAVYGSTLPDGWAEQRVAAITADPTVVVAPSVKRTTTATVAKAPSKKAAATQVKGRKPSAAASVVKGVEPEQGEAPKPRAAKVRAARKVEETKAETEQVAPIATAGAEARKAALKKRLKASAEDAGMALVTKAEHDPLPDRVATALRKHLDAPA